MENNDFNKQLEFYSLLEQLIKATTGEGEYNPLDTRKTLAALCRMFRINKAISTFFETLNHERLGKGEVLIGYDEGKSGFVAHSVRIATRAGAVVTCSAYMAEDSEPLTEKEREQVDLIIRTVLNFVSRMRLQRVVQQLAFHDDKGYRNNRFFMRTLGQINEKHALGGKTAIDYNLRHFSLVNQEIGRKFGDVAMRNHFNGVERLIGDTGTVCRLGGDNFVAICGKERLDAVLSYLNETPVIYDANTGRRIMVCSSAGVYPIPEGFFMRDPGEIMDKIISALMAARSGGKERIIFFNEMLRANKEKKMRIQQRFPEALRNEEFHVFYQPKIDVHTGELSGAEALCRWFRSGQIVPPPDFIPVLEETNEICKLDFYMLDHVCSDLRRWLNEGKKVVRISVNLSRKHMMDVDLLQNIIDIIDRHNVPHQYIEFELTETTTDVEFRDLKRVVFGLQQVGIYTSVDDFGVGYSSLNLIREIPWNVLKVDRSFLPVKGETHDSARGIMFKYVVAMARELGLECIAEGVETQEQVDVLRSNHCDLAQGFFFDKPLPVEQFEKRLDGFVYEVPKDSE